MNTLGQTVYDKFTQSGKNSFAFDISTMPLGMYLLKIEGKGIIDSQKIVIQR